MAARRILIQAGHNRPLEPGFESGTGTAGEAVFVADIQSRLGRLLAADPRLQVTLCPGNIPDGWTGDVFVSLHADGATSTKASGYSFGYPPTSTGSKLLADILSAEYARIPGAPKRRADNYTADMSGYYGWRRTIAPAQVLVEHGFLTNPAERAWLTAHGNEIARAWQAGILRFFDLPVEQPADFWAWARWWRGHAEYKQYGPRRGPRPNVPGLIPAAWWARLRKNIGVT